MPRYRFSWENLPATLVSELADAAKLPSDDACEQLRLRYGARPKDEFVAELWPELREVWLATDDESRNEVVEHLRNEGLGDLSVDPVDPPAQMDYLRSLRNAKTLRAVVLRAFHTYGEAPLLESRSESAAERPGAPPAAQAHGGKTDTPVPRGTATAEPAQAEPAGDNSSPVADIEPAPSTAAIAPDSPKALPQELRQHHTAYKAHGGLIRVEGALVSVDSDEHDAESHEMYLQSVLGVTVEEPRLLGKGSVSIRYLGWHGRDVSTAPIRFRRGSEADEMMSAARWLQSVADLNREIGPIRAPVPPAARKAYRQDIEDWEQQRQAITDLLDLAVAGGTDDVDGFLLRRGERAYLVLSGAALIEPRTMPGY